MMVGPCPAATGINPRSAPNVRIIVGESPCDIKMRSKPELMTRSTMSHRRFPMHTSTVPVPAAQYLRMSTDMQECSIENQAVVIKRYADANGFKILKTYEDAGKSGLVISQRRGLQSLLSDVLQ